MILLSLNVFLSFCSLSWARGNSMKVMTMNIHCFKDNWRFRLTHILNRVIAENPDLVSFQEVCKSDTVSQVKFISQYLLKNGYHLSSATTQFTHRAWDSYDELLMSFSRHKVKNMDKGFLPWSPLRRGYIAMEIDGKWFINVHLEHRPDYARYREEQLNFLATRFVNIPHVIMGDFNSSPSTHEQQILVESNYSSYFPGNTHVGDDGNVMANIDGFWVSPGFSYYTGNHQATIILDRPVGGDYLSDHFAVVFTYKDYAR